MISNVMDLKSPMTTPPLPRNNCLESLKDAGLFKHEALSMVKYMDQLTSNVRKEVWEKVLRVLPTESNQIPSLVSPHSSPVSSPCTASLSPISSPRSPTITQCPSFETFLLEWERGPYFPYMTSLLQDALLKTRNSHPELSRDKSFATLPKQQSQSPSTPPLKESHSLFGTDFISVLQQLTLLQHWIPTLNNLPASSKRTLLDTASTIYNSQSWNWRNGEFNSEIPNFSKMIKCWVDNPVENMKEITIFFGAIGFLATHNIIEDTYMFPGTLTAVFTSTKSHSSASPSPSSLPKPPPSLNNHNHNSTTNHSSARASPNTSKHFLPEITPLDRRAQSPSTQFWFEHTCTPVPAPSHTQAPSAHSHSHPHSIPQWIGARGIRSHSPLSYESVYHTPEFTQQDTRRSPSPNKISSAHSTPTNANTNTNTSVSNPHLESIAVSALEALGSVAANLVNLSSPPHSPLDSQNSNNNSRTSTPVQTPSSPPTLFSHHINFSNNNIDNTTSSPSTTHKRRDMCGDNNTINNTTKKQCVMSISNILCS
eukprot:TRINITY_DN6129_c0_g1_i1.p1 TRINITY_DN6129_c0_g1~~TRINITY_DN6129_c0_g1_i1.p1  ORF type:complete len:539 (-),score=107.10 TRINITY_DN6129_c0_g1_i1:235-1851(-)